MKKFTALLLALVMVLSLAACGAKNDATTDIADSTTLLSNVFAQYAEEEKFPIGGGAGDAMVMDAPGAMDVTDTETLDFMVGLPVDSAAMVDDAASALHMMNANTFTAACFRVTDSANVETVVKALQENIQARQWMCGIPETLLLYTLGNEYVLFVMGTAENVDTFRPALKAAYPDAVAVFDGPMG